MSSNGSPAAREGWGGLMRPDRRSLVWHGPESAPVAGGRNRGGAREEIGDKP
jgi:hypothetical protein